MKFLLSKLIHIQFDDNQSANKGWIASAQSPLQQRIVNQLPKDQQVIF